MLNFMGFVILGMIVLALVMTFLQYKTKDYHDGFEIFKIKKGSHYSIRPNRVFPIPFKIKFQLDSLKFTALFTETCAYDSTSNDSINKLYGISFGFDPHYRSVRIGWRYNSNLKVIELFVYAYAKGKVIKKHLLNIALLRSVEFSIAWNKSKNQVAVKAYDGCGYYFEYIDGIDQSLCNFTLWPYFGGQQAAPHDMKILIDEQTNFEF